MLMHRLRRGVGIRRALLLFVLLPLVIFLLVSLPMSLITHSSTGFLVFAPPAATLTSFLLPYRSHRYTYMLTKISGGFCNQLISLTYALTLCEDGDAILALDKEWSRMVRDNINVEAIASRIQLDVSSHQNVVDKWIQSDDAVRCGSNVVMRMFELVKPAKVHQLKAKNLLKQLNVKHVLAVHLRNFEGLANDNGAFSSPFRTFCHYDGVVPNYARTFIEDYAWSVGLWEKMKFQVWPEFKHWHDDELGIFVATDGERPDIDATYFNQDLLKRTNITSSIKSRMVMRNHTKERYNADAASKESGSMAIDMWAAVLADLYYAVPTSSCEQVIALWRLHHNPRALIPFPQSCFDKYATTPQETDSKQLCRHANTWALLEPLISSNMSVCSRVLALASALTKAEARIKKEHVGIDFLMHGSWTRLVRDVLDFEQLQRGAMERGIRFRFVEQLSQLSRSVSHNDRQFFYIGLNPALEVRCAGSRNDVRGTLKSYVIIRDLDMVSLTAVRDAEQDSLCCGGVQSGSCDFVLNKCLDECKTVQGDIIAVDDDDRFICGTEIINVREFEDALAALRRGMGSLSERFHLIFNRMAGFYFQTSGMNEYMIEKVTDAVVKIAKLEKEDGKHKSPSKRPRLLVLTDEHASRLRLAKLRDVDIVRGVKSHSSIDIFLLVFEPSLAVTNEYVNFLIQAIRQSMNPKSGRVLVFASNELFAAIADGLRFEKNGMTMTRAVRVG